MNKERNKFLTHAAVFTAIPVIGYYVLIGQEHAAGSAVFGLTLVASVLLSAVFAAALFKRAALLAVVPLAGVTSGLLSSLFSVTENGYLILAGAGVTFVTALLVLFKNLDDEINGGVIFFTYILQVLIVSTLL